MDIKMFGQITNAFGPSGFEEEAPITLVKRETHPGLLPEI